MADSEIAGLTEDTTPDATDNVYAQDAAGNVDKRVPLSALTTITTTATTVNAAGAVMESDYDAHTVLAATSDNTPAALTVAEQTLVGRITSGNITALSAAQVRTLLDVPTNAEAVLDTLFDAQTILAATSDNTPAAVTVAEQTLLGRITGGNIDDLSVAQVLTLLGTAALYAPKATFPVTIGVALSDETTAITTGTAKATIRAPFAFTLTAVRATLTTASSSGLPTVDINDSGTTVLSTKLTIDATELTSTTAVTAAVISDSAIADDASITFDIDVAGTGAAGLKVWLIGTRVLA